MSRIVEPKDFPEIEELVKLTEHDKIVLQLQLIMKKLLLETEIIIEDSNSRILIEPICIEAYYYKEKIFEDTSVHKKEGLQTNHFGKLYIHRSSEKKPSLSNRGGIDLCLSSGDYYLSFLIRDSYVSLDNSTPVFVDGPGRLIKYLSGQEFGEKKEKLSKSIITNENFQTIEDLPVLYMKSKKTEEPVYNTIRVNIPYDRKATDKKYQEEKNKEKYVFALLGVVKGMK